MKTKLYVFSTLIFLVSAASLFAQSSLEIGGKIGINFASLNGVSIPPGNSTRKGLLIGGFLSYKLTSFLALEPEALYSAKGATGSQEAGESYTIAIDYFEVPILLKFLVPSVTSIPVNLNVYAGPDLNYNISSNATENVNGVMNVTNETANTSPFDFNLLFGAGIGFKVGLTDLLLDFRYSYSLSSAGANNFVFKNSTFALVSGVGFSL